MKKPIIKKVEPKPATVETELEKVEIITKLYHGISIGSLKELQNIEKVKVFTRVSQHVSLEVLKLWADKILRDVQHGKNLMEISETTKA